ncbi:ABC transporter permease [Sporosarcina sp. G11-34]|uniref:ABC transporter permease n=1 Tax=Sporosarcina sp. G11-34 TaxID=2849605 RepID=UPI0022A95C2D|nr:ABC transporter permease [Sporosarcina sp. G11-34]MCZ2258093.1 ABC transporter permease [Sporosarcina sp. G11-34]
MRNSLKVAKWEIKRNMTNKSFIISLLSTPVIFLAFFFIPMLFNKSDSGDNANVDVYVYDELGVWNELQKVVDELGLSNWTLIKAETGEVEMQSDLLDMEQSVYLAMTEKALEQGQVKMYMTDDMDEHFPFEATILEEPLRQLQMDRLGLTDAQKKAVAKHISIVAVDSEVLETEEIAMDEADPLKRMIPGAFAGIILFSIVMTGMMIFQSASQEKKEKVAEIILSSLTPTELMQGKIIGYFVLGITQVVVWLVVAIPAVVWRFDFPLLEYLLVPELFLLLFIAFAGYLLFAAIFVGIGATVEDMTATSNFQGIVIMLPFLPVILIGPILADPSGLIAQIGSFIPITAPAVLLVRLSILDEWPWMEIGIAVAVLVFSIWLFMKLAGKIFNMGIMMYGKNATPKEIWKSMWA